MTSRGRAGLGLTALALTLAGCASLPFGASAPHGSVGRFVVDETQARGLIAAYRQAHGLSDIALDPALARVAQRQADAMAAANELSHTVDGALSDRLAREGADRPAAAENVSAGYATLEAALEGWRHSPPHDANLRFAPIRRMGIAAATAPTTRFKTFWALVMTD